MTDPSPGGPEAKPPAAAGGPGDELKPVVGLVRWLLAASPEPGPEGGEPERTRRLLLARERLSNDPALSRVSARLRSLAANPSTVRVLSELGLPDHPSLGKEAFRRVSDRILPRAEDPGSIYSVLSRSPVAERDARWLESLPEEAVAPWSELLAVPPPTLFSAGRLVALRAAGVGLSRDLLELRPGRVDLDSPFFELHYATKRLAEAPGDATARAAFEACLASCQEELAASLAHLDERGVSTDVLYRLELLEAQLGRLSALVGLALGEGDGRAFTAELLRGVRTQQSLRSLFRSTGRRLARKVVEHTSQTGEHYVVRDRKEWRATGNAGAGGGILTTLTAILKHGIHALPLAPAIEGIAYSLNYAASFVAMQLGHLALASKQPAMTASALAAAMEREGDDESVVELSAGVVRSQAAATLGNVLVGIPFAVFVDILVRLAAGHPILGAETAAYTLGSFHPWRSPTLVFAALTGVLLWMGSLVSGWTANWSAYRRLPEAVAQSASLARLAGRRGAEATGRFLDHHLGSLAGNVALGFLLGFTPSFLKFFGLPFEVRHVTLSACSVGLSIGSQWGRDALQWRAIGMAVAGVAVIGVLNIGVSFFLALRVAAGARGLTQESRSAVGRKLLETLWRNPRRFLAAPAERAGAPAPP